MQFSQDAAQLLQRFRAELKRSGAKATPQRLEVFREVIGSSEHPDAEAVYRGVRRRIPSISLDTVYRTLWFLLQRGLIDTLGPIHPHHTQVRFDGNIRPHHHFICKKCGRVYDFTNRDFDELAVPDEVKAWGNVEKAHVELKGLCLRCVKKQKGLTLKNKS